MPYDYDLSLTPRASASVNVPRVEISLVVKDSETGEVLHDFTGANTIMFPNVLGTLTQEQRLAFMHEIIHALIRIRLGL